MFPTTADVHAAKLSGWFKSITTQKAMRPRKALMSMSEKNVRGLNGLQSKPHEPVLFERSEFTGECAELPTE